MQRIWGFDVGTTSIGFAVIEQDEAEKNGRILRMGARIFPEGVTEKDREPRNKARRAARLLRRQFRRRRRRRKELGILLFRAGLLPAFDSDPHSEWNRTMTKQHPDGKTNIDPYSLRNRGLTDALTPYEVGRALYHLVKRRGFESSRIADQRDAEEEEEGKVKEAIGSLKGEMGDRTLGTFLDAQDKKRGRYIGRDMVRDEFDRLWKAQAEHHPTLLTEDLRQQFEDLAFYQRPTFWRLGTLGNCWLEPDSPLSLNASWKAQQFLMLQRLNSLRFAGSNEPELDAEERRVILELLSSQSTVTFGAVRRALKKYWQGRSAPTAPKFNLEIGGDEDLKGNAVEAGLRTVFGAGWQILPARERLRDEIGARLFDVDYRRIGNKRVEIRPSKERETLRRQFVAAAIADYGISEEQANRLSELRLPRGWTRHSEVAIDRLLPHLEEGVTYGKLVSSTDMEFAELRERLFPNRMRPPEKGAQRLPSHPKRMPALRNPTVARALTELRKVANNLLAAHGTPDLIRIELVREMTRSGRQRRNHQKLMRDRERERKKAKAELARNGFVDPSGADIEKWLLWQECKETCPYTGMKIDFDGLFRTGRCQVEHIFPRSRSLDNNYSNKTLCHVDENIRKGDRTPHEFYGSDTAVWDTVRQRARSLFLPHAEKKLRRFLSEHFADLGTDEFSERQLRDTSYIAREARDFVAGLGVPVETCNGSITRQLARRWGLDALLNSEGKNQKNREDHRHHAIDALAVALTTRAFAKRLGDYYARERRGEKPNLPLPWDRLWDDTKAAVEAVVVSHRAQRKLSGRLHEQTFLGDTGHVVKSRKDTAKVFVKRKPIGELSESEIGDIRDGGIRRAIARRLGLEQDGDEAIKQKTKQIGKARFEELLRQPLWLPRGSEQEGTPVKTVRLTIRRKPSAVLAIRADRKTYAELAKGTLHHLKIFVAGGKVSFRAMTLPELVQRRTALASSPDGSHDSLLLTIGPGDMLEMEDTETGELTYVVVRKCNQAGQIFYKPHNMAVGPKPEVSLTPGHFLKGRIRKVSVDPIGRIRPAND